MEKQINFAIQVLPETAEGISYVMVDEAIRVIDRSGYRYKVCPFETVVECTLEEALSLIHEIHEACRKAGTQRMLVNIKIQSDFTRNVTIEDKMEKYE
ncbi:MAG: thiamine-binding protein [Bacteroidota bacterium]